MRIIKNSHLMELAARHPKCLPAAIRWKAIITDKPDITNFAQLRQRFPHADQVTVKSNNIVTVFNLSNKHRFIAAIHYNRQAAYVLRLLTHAEYDKDDWKKRIMKTTKKITHATLPKTYEGLVRLHMPRPIRDKVAYENTFEILDILALLSTNGKLNQDQEDYLTILTDLVEAYDKENSPPDPHVSGLDMLKYLMEEHDLTGDDLARILRVDRSLAYRILNAQRNLTTAHIKALSSHFNISAGIFID
jgi:antitoxin component HigA of HigAB toxin-antitoxin module/mRNA-degrading endonuclease HigB of HigAB toxin-antitoxin module